MVPIPAAHEDEREDKSKQTEIEPNSSLPPEVNASQITLSAANSWACGSGNMAYGVCVWGGGGVSVCLHITVGR